MTEPSEELDQVMEAIPLDVERAFSTWWDDPSETSGVLDPEDEAACYVAFAAGVEAARKKADG